jgi:hypothetical protein
MPMNNQETERTGQPYQQVDLETEKLLRPKAGSSAGMNA